MTCSHVESLMKPFLARKIHPVTLCCKRAVRFAQVGGVLHLTAMTGILILIWAGTQAFHAWAQDRIVLGVAYGWLALCGWIVPVFAELDALSRFQNYKKAKDLFHENGVKPRGLKLFIHSRCQRVAIRVAARDLGLHNELARHVRGLGYRWYHILPDFICSNPGILFSRRYWQRTLFEKKYQSRHFFW